jgi:hypothetical protein
MILDGGLFGIKFVNSWKYTWGDKGRGILTENKARAAEQIAIQRVSPLALAA